jgi:4-carboxymuconolactone decarboxylase
LARMRLTDLSEMSPEQKSAYDEAVAGRRGHVPAPMRAWLRNPELSRRAQKLGEFIRFEMALPARLREMAILLVARYWSAHHEWLVHKKIALEEGVSAEVVAAITARRRPEFEESSARAVYAIATSLLETRTLPAALYQEGVRELGEQQMVELVGVLGYYTLVSMTLVAFEIGLPEDFQTELLAEGDETKR